MNSVKNIFKNAWIFLVFGAMPLLIAFLYFLMKMNSLERQQNQIVYLLKKKSWVEKKQEEEKKILSHLKNADKEYVEKNLEKLPLLQSEITHLQALSYSTNEQPAMHHRLNFLQSNNKLQFNEQNFQRVGKIQETELLQIHPVEMDTENLKELLYRIENFQDEAPSPQLIIKNFCLSKKALSESYETYIIKLDLIKRELIDE